MVEANHTPLSCGDAGDDDSEHVAELAAVCASA
jgi:hypothetical protein